ncbi:MAG TPA: hypothetical protein VJ276_13725 [Thermoanaerobaculia bacterium]|nr:hypothetical protein [Thermoanaerobaculia bacterium]
MNGGRVVLALLQLTCSGTLQVDSREARVFQAAYDHYRRDHGSPVLFAPETVDPSNMPGAQSLRLAAADPLYEELIAQNGGGFVSLRSWLSAIPSARVIPAALLRAAPSRWPYDVERVLVFAKPVFSSDGQTALAWVCHLDHYKPQGQAAVFVPEDLVLSLRQTDDGWRVTRVYSWSPD